MTDINKQIEELVENMSKSTKTPEELLKETILEVGPEGLKKALPELSEEQTELLKSVLEEMKKSASPSMDADYSPEHDTVKVKDIEVEEEHGKDDKDEKLVKEKNKDIKHQGDNNPEGFEGQVIKGEEIVGGEGDKKKDAEFDKKDLAIGSEVEKEHSEKKSEAKEIAKDHLAENKKYYDSGKEAGKDLGKDIKEAKEKVVKKSCGKEEKSMTYDESEEAKEDLKKKASKKEAKMKKSKEELQNLKDSIIKSLKEEKAEISDEIIKSKMKEALLAENGSPEQPVDLPKEEPNETIKPVQKSIQYWPKNPLAARTGGRNHHFSVNDYYEEVTKAMKEEPKEEIHKSENKDCTKYDINDIIEKSDDRSINDVNQALQTIQSPKSGEFTKKSFDDKEVAKAMGMSEEEIEKIFRE